MIIQGMENHRIFYHFPSGKPSEAENYAAGERMFDYLINVKKIPSKNIIL